MNKTQRLILNSKRLKQLRQQNGFSQEALADACEQKLIRLSIATIKRAETSRPVNFRTAKNIAKFFDIELDKIIAQNQEEIQNINQDERSQSNKIFLIVSIQATEQNLILYFKNEMAKITPYSYSNCPSTKLFVVDIEISTLKERHNILGKIYNICQAAKQLTSIFHSFSCYITSLQSDSHECALEKGIAQVTQILQIINLIPINNLIASEGTKLLFNDTFFFNYIGNYSEHPLWSLDDQFNFDKKTRVEIIGRDIEIKKIKNIVDNTIEHSTPSLTCIHGDKGIGKSRLLHEISHFYFHLDFKVAYFDLCRKSIDWWSITEIILSFIKSENKYSVLLVIDNIDECDGDTLAKIKKLQLSITTGTFAILVSAENHNVGKINDSIIVDHTLSLNKLDKESCQVDLITKLNLTTDQVDNVIESSSCVPLYLRMMLSKDNEKIESTLKLLIQKKITTLPQDEIKLLNILAVYGKQLKIDEIQSIFENEIDFKKFSNFGLINIIDHEYITLVNITVQRAIIEIQSVLETASSHEMTAKIILSKTENLAIDEWCAVKHHFTMANNNAKVAWCCSRIANLYLISNHYDLAENIIYQGLGYIKEIHSKVDSNIDNYIIHIEIEIKLLLAKIYTLKFGWGYFEIETLYLEVLEQCDVVSATSRKMETLFGLWAYNLSNCKVKNANNYAKKAEVISGKLKDPYFKMMTSTSLCTINLWLGNHNESIKNATEALMSYSRYNLDNYQVIEGLDPRMLPYYTIVMSKALLEEQDAEEVLKSMLDLVHSLDQKFNHVIAYHTAAQFYWLQREPKKASYYASELLKLTETHTFSFYRGIAQLFEGWTKFISTRDSQFISQIVHAYEVLMTNAGGELCYSFYAVILAEALIADNQSCTATEFLEQAIVKCNSDKTECYLPELMALKGLSTKNQEEIEQALTHPLCSPRQRSIIKHYLPTLHIEPIV